MCVSINLGDVFAIDTPKGQHYAIAIAQTSSTHHLFVNVVSRRTKSETACILLPGPDVPGFIIHESAIDYDKAREINVWDLEKYNDTW